MNNMRDILDLINEMSEEEGSVELHDEFDIELTEDIVIESGIIDINEDGILIESDEKAIQLLEEHGLILEDADWSKYDEPTVSRIKKGATKPVDKTDYNKPAYQRKKEKEEKKLDEKMVMGLPGDGGSKVMGEGDMDEAKLQFKVLSGNQAKKYFSNFPNITRATPIDRLKGVTFNDLQVMGSPTWSYKKSGEGKPLDRSLTEVIYVLEFSDGTVLAIFNHLPHHEVYDEPEVRKAWHIVSPGGEHAPKKGMDLNYYIDTALEGDEDNQVSPDTEFRDSSKKDVEEAKYQGREVPLGKPMAGDVKKSKVYVKKPNGKVVKVNFGDKKMRIKKSNPKRRKSFRARHNCKNPGPRWKARYWSCRAW